MMIYAIFIALICGLGGFAVFGPGFIIGMLAGFVVRQIVQSNSRSGRFWEVK